MRTLRTTIVCVCIALCLTGCSLAAGPTLEPVKMLVPKDVMRGVPSPDGRTVAATTATGLDLVNVESGETKLLVSSAGGVFLPDVEWSPAGRLLTFRQRAGGRWPLLQVIDTVTGRKITLGDGIIWGWSPDGKQIAWTPMPSSPRSRIVSDASTGAQVSRTGAYAGQTSQYTQSPPVRTFGRSKAERPETWRDRHYIWVSPDGSKAIWEEWKRVSDPSTMGGGPGTGWKPALEAVWLGYYVAGTLNRQVKLLGTGAENDVSSLVWYPDSSRALLTTESSAAQTGARASRLFQIGGDGSVTQITVQEHSCVAFPRILDAEKGLVVYCVREGGVDKASLWLGQLKSAK
jgi:hypothetical protein